MTSIRQRRRNRHRVKAAKRQQVQALRSYLTLGINTFRVKEAFAQIENAMTILFETMAQPEFQESVNRTWQELARFAPLKISKITGIRTLRKSFNFESPRTMLFADREAELLRQYELAHHQYQLGRIQENDGLGDVSCKFDARSPHVQCAINPTGECSECSFYES